ncbi:LytR family transcriptional regulator [Streptococcus bovimastitidis]|uniref:LytR family transcriptional regulator n=1 Tax=Streptococcus bovimastitidis TaxID=1856638 RepID=A0A1L8MNI2_9STRE|nr:LytR family transcriptional regulator [Streptococcus bovimastitidis]OJF72330.1 LytR family transcriptional regulator [Streptococcus bovimastitidis]
MTEIEKTIDILLGVYAYNHAFKIAQEMPKLDEESLFLLEMVKERRELNLAFLTEHKTKLEELEKAHNFNFFMNEDLEKEQIANYLLDLEVKIKNGDIIDFVRSVSPILYRLFQTLIRQQIPNFDSYIIDAKNDEYDTWNFHKMKAAGLPIFETYLEKRQSRNITTRSLTDLLILSELPQEMKETIKELRRFEKSVRNPLAHLIKAFDEEELNRTTNFSSQAFLNKIIELATFSGVSYQRQPYYFDQVNEIIKKGFNDY